MSISLPRIVITAGEPAGIGPDIVLQIAQKEWPAELVVIADRDLLIERAKQLQLPITLIEFDEKKPRARHQPHSLKIISLSLKTPTKTGILNRENAAYVLETLTLATDLCLQKKADALVTAPVHKAIMNEAGINFKGHTEFLAARCKATQALMLFVTEQTKVALATTHIPLSAVSRAITQDHLILTLELLYTELQKCFQIENPKILVCGLNPHAGENGYLGREEIEVIEPALAYLRKKNKNIVGPLPADTIFTEKYLNAADAILAMYHDQALPVVKYSGFGNAVNVTLGLPIIRTSVDHGTALDIAGTGKADASSLAAAIQLAIQLQ